MEQKRRRLRQRGDRHGVSRLVETMAQWASGRLVSISIIQRNLQPREDFECTKSNLLCILPPGFSLQTEWVLSARSPSCCLFLFFFFPTCQQDFAVQELPSTRGIQHVESVEAGERGQCQRPYEQQEKNAHEKARRQHVPNKAGGRKKYEPCPRWKGLGLTSSNGYVMIPLVKWVLIYPAAAA